MTRSSATRRPRLLTALLALGYVASAAVGAAPVGAPTAARAAGGPVAHWTFDDGTGTTASDSAGDNDGVLQGAAAFTDSAAVGTGAISFAGAGAGVVVPNSAALEPTSLTIAAWVKEEPSSGQPHFRTIIQKGANACEGGSWGLQALGDLTIYARVETPPAAYAGSISVSARLSDNEWHHVAFTYDAAAGKAKTYVDGEPADAQGVPFQYGLPTANDLYIGLAPVECPDQGNFRGELDDLRIYDRALTTAEVQALAPPVAATTTTTLDVGAQPETFADLAPLKATVAPPPSTSAQVHLYRTDGGRHDIVATGWTSETGEAQISLPTEYAVGTYEFEADFVGTARYPASQSDSSSYEIVRQGRTLTLSVDKTAILLDSPIQLTATANDYTNGDVTFVDTPSGGTSANLGTASTTWDGVGYQAFLDVPSLTLGSHTITAVLAETAGFGGATSSGVTVVVSKRPTFMSMFPDGSGEAGKPYTITVGIGPSGAAPAPTAATGTITLKDGATTIGTKAVSNWSAVFNVASFSVGTHDLTATYTGDSYWAASSVGQPLVIGVDTVHATNVGLSATTFYPVVDHYQDTVAVRGTRGEPISVAIRIYSPTNALVRSASYALGTGAYSFAWNGKTSSGTLLAAGTYRVVQSLRDGAGSTLSVTKSVYLSRKRLVTKTIYVVKKGSAIGATGKAGGGSVAVSTTGGYARLSAGSNGGWAGAGWELTLPSATIYSKITYQIYAKGPLSAPPNWLGVEDFRQCTYTATGWDTSCFANWVSVGSASGTAWFSAYVSPTYDRHGRQVRGIVSTNYGTVYVYKVQLKVTYGVLTF